MYMYIHVYVYMYNTQSRPLLLPLSFPLYPLPSPLSTPGHNYHVTVPYQPMATYNEGLLQLSRSESQISILPATSSNPILDIPYSQIRRFGYQVCTLYSDIM